MAGPGWLSAVVNHFAVYQLVDLFIGLLCIDLGKSCHVKDLAVGVGYILLDFDTVSCLNELSPYAGAGLAIFHDNDLVNVGVFHICFPFFGGWFCLHPYCTHNVHTSQEENA